MCFEQKSQNTTTTTTTTTTNYKHKKSLPELGMEPGTS